MFCPFEKVYSRSINASKQNNWTKLQTDKKKPLAKKTLSLRHEAPIALFLQLGVPTVITDSEKVRKINRLKKVCLFLLGVGVGV